MPLEDPQEKFLQLLREIKTDYERKQFLKWVHVNWDLGCLPDDEMPSERILKAIVEEIRSTVPFNGVLSSEKISLPVCGPNSDCKSHSTVHIDEFLYNDEDLDDLIEKGELSRHYCGDCFSQNIKVLSMYLLPQLETETIIDVGSRFGGVLYGAYLYTSSSNIIGVEINPELCKIQTDIVKKFNFSDRIKIICNSIINEVELLSAADVIILNNVFEFFADVEKTVSSWELLAENIKVGCLLVTVPHLSDTFQHIKVNFDWEDWVEELQPFQANNFICDEENLQSHKENVKHYRVKKKVNVIAK